MRILPTFNETRRMAQKITVSLTQTGQKSKAYPTTGHEGPEGEKRYRSTLSLTSALDGGGSLTPSPSRFTPEKGTRYPQSRRLGVTQNRSGRVRKISPLPGCFLFCTSSVRVCLDCPAFCLFVFYLQPTTQSMLPAGSWTRNPSDRSATGIGRDSIPGPSSP